jgi:hypothetical protein
MQVLASLFSRNSGRERIGTQTPSLDGLSLICKGFRRGELVIFTGPTGYDNIYNNFCFQMINSSNQNLVRFW